MESINGWPTVMEYPCIHLPILTRLPIQQNSNHVLNRLSVSHTEQLAQSPIQFRQEVVAVMQIIVKFGASSLRRKRFLFTWHIAHLRQQCPKWKSVIFQEKRLKDLKCYNFIRVQRRHNCFPAPSSANFVMTLGMLKMHLPTFLSIPITQICQMLGCDNLVVNER